MDLTLNEKQRVSVSSRVCFHHRADSGREYRITLDIRQFLNLHDYIRDYNTLSSVSHYPLGDNVWLYHEGSTTELTDSRKKCFFSFYEESWNIYIQSTHYLIYDLLQNGKSYDHQFDAKHERRRRHRARRHASNVSKYNKTLHRSTRDARHENEEWSQHANVSERQSSNSWPHYRRRGRKHASRIYREIKDAQDNRDGNSDDNFESGSECDIKEESVSEEDHLE